MLSLLGIGVKYLWDYATKSSAAVEKTEEDDCEIPLRQSDDLEAEKEKRNGIEIKGEVTSIDNFSGFVDEYIFFDFNVVEGDLRPEIGTKVIVNAICQDDGRWTASKVFVARTVSLDDEDWGIESVEFAKDRFETNEVGKVTIFDKVNGGYVNDCLKFDLSNVKEGFVPCEGDWVTVNLIKSRSEMREKVVCVAPSHTRKIEGKVVQINADFGVIDNDIYFRRDCINETLRLKRGERVNATVIECSFRKYVWRAIYIVPIITESENINENVENRNKVRNLPLQNLLSDKNGISVTTPLDFGSVMMGKKSTLKIKLSNGGEESQTLLSFKLESSANKQFEVRTLFKDILREPLVLRPGEEVGFVADCQPCILGKCSQLLVFNFHGFTIGRILTATACFANSLVHAPKSPFRKSKHKNTFSMPFATQDDNWIIPGQQPKPENNWKRNYSALPQYKVPKELWSCVMNKNDLIKLEPTLLESLNETNYKRRFQTLLYLEEIALELEIDHYTMEDVTLQRHNNFLTLEVPGILENRPPLIIRDIVIVEHSKPAENGKPPVRYEGCVHDISESNVYLMFHPTFQDEYNDELLNVYFKINRTTLRRCHQSVQLSDLLGNNVLFPKETHLKPPAVECTAPTCDLRKSLSPTDSRKRRVTVVDRLFSTSPNAIIKTSSDQDSTFYTYNSLDIEWINENLNQRQKLAVRRILSGEARPTPYVIFGPPGTGKTVTVVEAVLQVLRLHENSRVLVCAPSNSAADLLTERFHFSGKLTSGTMIRINAMLRSEKNIPECIMEYCCITVDVDVQAHYRLIISTCSTAAIFRTLNLADQHFTHVFVDEAGQATEPECLIPILYCGPDGQIILAGDPFQLGAVVRSKMGLNCGFSMSFLERLMQRYLYSRDAEKYPEDFYNPLLVTKLINNYRSHPALLTTSSELFYENELIPEVDSAEFHNILNYHFIPNKGFPLIFNGIQGEMLREGNNPSWFNPVEVIQIMRYIRFLYNENISPNDIGVVTPYRKQVEKIRFMLESLKMDKPKVGSTEEFQGQEKLVIIISTVRSGGDGDHSEGGGLGFLRNKKRFNVAVTRPKGLLIVVGDPFVLSEDPCWRKLLDYTIENGGYIGCDLPIFTSKTS
uniref:RNA helicase n=1 Tax=Strigamia maritima TaxID=126957 RepID=T1J397_STRMM